MSTIYWLSTEDPEWNAAWSTLYARLAAEGYCDAATLSEIRSVRAPIFPWTKLPKYQKLTGGGGEGWFGFSLLLNLKREISF